MVVVNIMKKCCEVMYLTLTMYFSGFPAKQATHDLLAVRMLSTDSTWFMEGEDHVLV